MISLSWNTLILLIEPFQVFQDNYLIILVSISLIILALSIEFYNQDIFTTFI